jgi:hypothetical protein
MSRLQEETAKVEEHLLRDDSFSQAIINCFNHSKADSFENFLEPLQKLLRLSPPIASSLIHPDLFLRTAQKLRTKKALVRLNLLRIIRSICDSSDEDGALIHTFGLHPIISETAKFDPAILVREMASDLIKSSELHVSRAVHNARVGDVNSRRQLRRSSSSTMVPTNNSLPPTPTTDRIPGRISSYFDPSADLQRPFSRGATGMASPYRPISRDGGSGGSSTAWSSSSFLASPSAIPPVPGLVSLDRNNSNNINSLVSKSRLPRTNHSRGTSGARLSLVTAEGRTSRPGSRSGLNERSGLNDRSTENLTPKSAVTGHTRTPSRLGGHHHHQLSAPSVGVGHLRPSRGRRMTSSGSNGVGGSGGGGS